MTQTKLGGRKPPRFPFSRVRWHSQREGVRDLLFVGRKASANLVIAFATFLRFFRFSGTFLCLSFSNEVLSNLLVLFGTYFSKEGLSSLLPLFTYFAAFLNLLLPVNKEHIAKTNGMLERSRETRVIITLGRCRWRWGGVHPLGLRLVCAIPCWSRNPGLDILPFWYTVDGLWVDGLRWLGGVFPRVFVALVVNFTDHLPRLCRRPGEIWCEYNVTGVIQVRLMKMKNMNEKLRRD